MNRKTKNNGVVGGPYARQTESGRIDAPTDQLCALTDIGRTRDHNEDVFYISPVGPLLIVADGMGGHAAGEVASALAVEVLAESLGEELRAEIKSGTTAIEPLLINIFDEVQRRVLDAGRARAEYRGMGTTLILALVQGDELYTCHVGDSRGYLRNKVGLEQITHDHSVVGELVDAGHLTSEQARFDPRKNRLLQAIGVPSGIVAESCHVTLARGDRILLCSDGLWEALSDQEICTILDGKGSMRQRATQLVDRANQAGGKDNITVALYEHCPDERSPKQA